MAPTTAELSSLATGLQELSRRVTQHADAASAAKDDEVANELFAIERSLHGINRRLSRLLTTLDRR